MEQTTVLGNDTPNRSQYFFTNKELFKLFLPLTVEQLLMFLVGLANLVIVAAIGEAAVSGVSLVNYIMLLLIFLFLSLATGGAVIAEQYMGRNELKEAREAAGQMVWFVGAVSIVIMALIYLIKPFIPGCPAASLATDPDSVHRLYHI